MKQTGGRPPPTDLTPAESLFWERMCQRPSVHGLPQAVDTDEGPSGSAVICTGPQSSNESAQEVDVSNKRKTIKRNQAFLTLENTEKDTKRIELETLKLEKELEVLECKKAKLQMETEKLKSERELVEFRKIYYQLSIQKEHGIIYRALSELIVDLYNLNNKLQRVYTNSHVVMISALLYELMSSLQGLIMDFWKEFKLKLEKKDISV